MSFKFLQAKNIEKRVFSEKEKSELMEQALFLEELAHELQSMRFMAYQSQVYGMAPCQRRRGSEKDSILE